MSYIVITVWESLIRTIYLYQTPAVFLMIPIEISISSYLQSRLQQDAMDGPLTDYESFDSDPGSDCGLSDGEVCPSGGEPPPPRALRPHESESEGSIPAPTAGKSGSG